MGNYNAIAGISEENLNRLTSQVYSVLYQSSTIFKNTKVFDKLLLYSVSYDVTTAPVFTLAPSEDAKEGLLEMVKPSVADGNMLEEIKQYIVEGIVTFSLNISSVNVSVVLKKGEAPVVDLKASLTAGCSVEINAEGKVIPKIVSAKLKLPGYELIEEALNSIALPVIIELVNGFVSKGFTLPLMKLVGTNFSHPLARIENRTLVTYVALESQGATVLPAQHVWPLNKTFAYFDKYVAESAAQYALTNTQKSGIAQFDLLGWSFSAGYTGGLKDPKFDLTGGVETGHTYTAYGSGRLSIKFLFFQPLSVSFVASATPTASSILTLSNGQLFYVLQHVNDFKVYVDFDFSGVHLPASVVKMINDNISFLLKPYAQLFGEIMHGLTIKICNIKPFEFDVSDTKVTIELTDKTITTTIGPDGKKLVSIEGILGAVPK